MEYQYQPIIEPTSLQNHLKVQKKWFKKNKDFIEKQNKSAIKSRYVSSYFGIDGTPISFGEYMSQPTTIVAQGWYRECFISTVFLSLVHGTSRCLLGNGSWSTQPNLFETACFLKECQVYISFFSTYEEAKIGHREAVEYIKINYETLEFC